MEAKERPSKKRKISDDGHPDVLKVSKMSSEAEEGPRAESANDEESIDRSFSIKGADEVCSTAAYDYADGSEAIENVSSSNVEENGLLPPDETAPLAESMDDNQAERPMSKSQQKKLRKKLEWEAKRDERKLIRKEKMVARRERRRAEKQQASQNGDPQPPPPAKKPKAQQPVVLPVTILIDCDFDDLMRDNERISLAAQITRSYSDNKNSMFRAHLAVCSFGGKLRERFDNVLMHYKGWRGVRFLECDFVEAAEKAKQWMFDGEQDGRLAGAFSHLADEDEEGLEKHKEEGEVVYLTSEADDTLTELKPYSTYIIGGLVDKNREKGMCYKRATKRDVRTAKLPIGELMDMQSRKVLATNHVNEIVLKWLECGDWGGAFMKVIPKRKGGTLKGKAGEDGEEGDEVERQPAQNGVHKTDDDERGSSEPENGVQSGSSSLDKVS